jgi:glucose/mannose transport system substrate-binding protein
MKYVVRTRLGRATALLCALGTACGDSEDKGSNGTLEDAGADQDQVEIYSWWTAGGEAQALSNLIDSYRVRFPGRQVLNSTTVANESGTVDEAVRVLRGRLATGQPPDAWQTIFGNQFTSYTQFQADADAGAAPVNVAADLRDLYESEGWLDKFPAGILESMKEGEGIYALPLSVGRINDLYYNKAIFAKYGLTPPSTMEDLWAIGEALKGAVDSQGNPIIPMAISSGYMDSAWPVRFVADAVLMAREGGVQFRQDYYAGKADPADPRYLAAANDFVKLLKDYTNAGNETLAATGSDLHALKLQWEGAADLVHSGRAAMFLHGNWVKAYLESKGDVADTDFGVVQFPPKAFVYAGDTFMMSKDAPHREAAIDFLKTIASPEVQTAFNKLKGALPARIDADTSGFDTVGRQTAEAFRDPSVSLMRCAWDYAPASYWDCWQKAVLDAVKGADAAAFASACVDKYPSLSE